MQLVVGLGNPGPSYEATRHNVGFWWIDALAQQLGWSFASAPAHKAWLAKGQWQGRPLCLLKPQTFMNLSGQSVASFARFFKLNPSQIWVVHDEIDLPPGTAKLKQGGGHAGHNGLKDIVAQLGSPDFWRLRLGVGHPGLRSEVVSWVLQKPSPADRTAIQNAIEGSLSACIPSVLEGEFARAQQNLATQCPKPNP